MNALAAAEHGLVALFFWAGLLLRLALLVTAATWLITAAFRLALRGRHLGSAYDGLRSTAALLLAALLLGLALRPDATALERLASRAYGRGDYERAIDLGFRAGARRGYTFELLLGRALQRTGDAAGALAAFERAQSLSAGDTTAHLEAARLLAASGEPGRARSELREAATAARSEAERREVLGMVRALGLEEP